MARETLQAGQIGAVGIDGYTSSGEKLEQGDGRRPAYYVARARYGMADGSRGRKQARGVSRSAAEKALRSAVRRTVQQEQERIEDSRRGRTIPRTWEGFAVNHLAWVEGEDSDLSDGSVRIYADAIRKHVQGEACPFTGRKLDSIAQLELRDWLQKVANEYGDGAAHTVKSVAGGMFRRALGYGIVPANPVAGMGQVKRSRRMTSRLRTEAASRAQKAGKAAPVERDHSRAFNADEQRRILAFIEHDQRTKDLDTADLVRFLLGTGVRLGEALALRWQDVDLTGSRGRIAINGTLVRKSGEGIIRQEWTKTADGMRTITIPTEVAQMLKARRERMEDQEHEHPLPASEVGAVFPSARGTWRDQSNTNTQLRRIFDHEDVAVPWATSHAFRRTVATTLFTAGVDPVSVAGHLGHSDPSFSMRVYGDTSTARGDAGEVLDRVAESKVATKVATKTDSPHLTVVKAS